MRKMKWDLVIFLMAAGIYFVLLTAAFLGALRLHASFVSMSILLFLILAALSGFRTIRWGRSGFKFYFLGAALGFVSFLQLFLFVGWVVSTNPGTNDHSSLVAFGNFLVRDPIESSELLDLFLSTAGVLGATLAGHYIGEVFRDRSIAEK